MLNLSKIRSKLLNNLELLFGNLPESSLSITIDQVEDFCKSFIKNCIIDYANDKGLKIDKSNYFIFYDKNIFQIEIVPDIFNPDILNIAILKMGIKNFRKKPKPHVMKIDSCGKYNKIQIYILNESVININEIAGIVETIFNTGYSWLLEKLRKTIIQTEENFTNDLLSFIRQFFLSVQKEKLLDVIYLLLVLDNKVIYVLDRFVSEKIIQQTRKRQITIDQSPAKLAAELFSKFLPYNLSFSKVTLNEGKRIDIDSREAQYRSNLSIFELAEQTIFNTPKISMQPLIFSEQYSVMSI